MAAQRPSIFACSSVRNASLPPPALRELPPSATAVTAQAVASARDPSPRACAVRRLGDGILSTLAGHAVRAACEVAVLARAARPGGFGTGSGSASAAGAP